MAQTKKKIGAKKEREPQAKKFTDTQVIEAIRKNGGLLALAAKALGCNRSTIHRRVQDSAKVAEACRAVREETIDMAEGVILKSIQAGDVDTAKWYLTRPFAKERGYNDRIEADVTTNQPAMVQIFRIPDNGRDSN